MIAMQSVLRKRPKTWLGIALTTILIAAIALYLFTRPRTPEGIIEASGQVSGTEVTLSAKVPGIAEVVAVRESERVAKGQLIAQIGAKEAEARLAEARAEQAAAAARIDELDARIATLDIAIDQSRAGTALTRGTTQHEVHGAAETVARVNAELQAAEAQQQQDARLRERYSSLLQQGFVSKAYFDEIDARSRASNAKLQAARRAREEAIAASQRAGAGAIAVDVAKKGTERLVGERNQLAASRVTLTSQADAAAARVHQAEAILADLRIASPIDGTVISRLAEPGELLASGAPIATLVDLSALYVKLYIAERDIGKVRLGSPVRLYANSFPDSFFTGRITEVYQRAEFTPKDVHVKDERAKLVIPVKVTIDNPGGLLKPGMAVDAAIKWQDEASW